MGIGIFSPVTTDTGTHPAVGIFSAATAQRSGRSHSWSRPAVSSAGRQRGSRVRSVTFGRNGSFTVRYDTRRGWSFAGGRRVPRGG